MARLQLRGALQSLDLDIPLEALVVVSSPGGDAAQRLAFGLIAAEAQHQMAPLLAPTWLPSQARLAPQELGSVDGLRTTFVFRHSDGTWPANARVGQVLGMLSLLSRALGKSDLGHCEVCSGAGRRATVATKALVPDPQKSIADGAIALWSETNAKFYSGVLQGLASQLGLQLDVPWCDLGASMQTVVLYGSPESNFKGVVHDVERRLVRSSLGRGAESLASLTPYLTWQACQVCEGTGLGREAFASSFVGLGVAELYEVAIADLPEVVESLLTCSESEAAHSLRAQFVRRVQAAKALGLGALRLGQRTEELDESGARSLRLGEVLSGGLCKALYVLEEPTAELSPAVRESTVEFLQKRVSAGDSLIIVSADAQLASEADWYVMLEAGDEPGTVRLRGQGRPSPTLDRGAKRMTEDGEF